MLYTLKPHINFYTFRYTKFKMGLSKLKIHIYKYLHLYQLFNSLHELILICKSKRTCLFTKLNVYIG